MRNPLHYSSDLLVKRAEQIPGLYIPQYTPPAQQPTLNDSQIEEMLKNIQSYPEEQQQKILDNINQNFGQAKYRGGLVGGALGGLSDFTGSAFDKLQGGVNSFTDTLFGWKPFDTQDAARSRARTVLQTAAQNPDLYKKITTGLQTTGIGAKQQTPAATTPAATPTPAAAAAAAATPATTPAVPVKPAPAAAKTESKVVSAPPAAKPEAPKRKEGLIEGIPASKWIAQNKARQKKEDAAYMQANPNRSVSRQNPNFGLTYNATTGQYNPPGYNMFAGKVI
jgi:hypothetical protein